MWKKFVLYGVLGLLVEVLWTGFGSMIKGDVLLRGTTSIWMFPIYGLAVLLEPVHYRIKHLPLIVRGGIYMLLIFAVELVSGLLLRLVLGECPWNYVNRTLSIYGIITLTYAPVWFAYGIMLEQVQGIIKRIERGLGSNAT
ncbi:MAG: putative ABC transporter permease [Clostridium sp.]|uniref:putative ABC transporter permease n=1 Tax=Clostridium sp. TaxID=1506 RepID=UPI003D6D6CB5